MIQRVGVVGAGTMGSGLAQLCAQSGFSVKISDADPVALEKAREGIRQNLDQAVLKGKLTLLQSQRALFSIGFSPEIRELEGADLVIEAVSEDLGLKRRVFQELDLICPQAILATNTSSLSVAAIAAAAAAPERVLGMHFFNPPLVMKLVELSRAPRTSLEAFQAAWDFALTALRKTPVEVKDTPGFIVNRVMRPFYLEALRLACQAGGFAALDEACRTIGETPMGPFELMDLIGLDVNLAITKAIYQALDRPERFAPSPLQESLVAAGCLGRKNEAGFYLYKAGRPTGENPKALALLPAASRLPPDEVWRRVMGAVAAEAERLFQEGAAGKSDIDMAVKLAMNFAKGPFEWLALKKEPSGG
ncbi:MAG: 3-hydroxybutyryl-CoA dehydrogenase [Elusimicrobia bacterium]|nr:3-hydroxybutyryl-CoA dehydrogenase [Elusimicrobiota bacterium]